MGPFAATASVLGNYFTFSGRASRSEYWWWALVQFIIVFVLTFVDLRTVNFAAEISVVAYSSWTAWFVVLTILPNFAVTIRRLHDSDKSGWWWLISFVPLGGLVIFVFTFLPSTNGVNRFGPPLSQSKKFKEIKDVEIPVYVSPDGFAGAQSAQKVNISEYYKNRVLPGQNQTEIATYDPEPDYPED